MAAGGSTSVVLVALGANLVIALAKFAAAAYTGSSAMLSEAIHSLVGTSNQGLLLYGLKRSTRAADRRHPLGYANELYFWSFIVAILLFAMGAGVSIYEGVDKLHAPHPVTSPEVSYVVLAIAIALAGFSTWKAISELKSRHDEPDLAAALRSSRDPALFTVVLEGLAALAGLCVAFAGILIAHLGGTAEADGVASIVIGLILAAVAAVMSIEVQALVAGEAVRPEVQAELRSLIAAEIGEGTPVRGVDAVRTMRLGPQDVLVAASLDFRDGETVAAVEQAIARLDRAIKARHPEVKQLYLEVRSRKDDVGATPMPDVKGKEPARDPSGSIASPAAMAPAAGPPAAAPAAAPGKGAARPAPAARPPGAKKKGKRHKR